MRQEKGNGNVWATTSRSHISEVQIYIFGKANLPHGAVHSSFWKQHQPQTSGSDDSFLGNTATVIVVRRKQEDRFEVQGFYMLRESS